MQCDSGAKEFPILLLDAKAFGVAIANDLEEALGHFKTQTAKSVEVLQQSGTKVGSVLRGLPIVGAVFTGIEESSYIASLPPDKQGLGYAASAANIAGTVVFSEKGAVLGAGIGLFATRSPIGMLVGGVVGGITGVFIWDKGFKQPVRSGITGIQQVEPQ